MNKEMTKMPDGSFAVDEEELVIERGSKAPYIPTIKLKGGSSELPPEVENAIETNGMGWTDEDETVHQIDEKYIPSSGGAMVVNFDFAYTEDGYTLTADKTVEEIMEAYWQGVVRGKIHYHNDDDVIIYPTVCEIASDRPMFLYMGDGEYVEALEWNKSQEKWIWAM